MTSILTNYDMGKQKYNEKIAILDMLVKQVHLPFNIRQRINDFLINN